jgi:hypothetical protein
MSAAPEALDRLILEGRILPAVRWIMTTHECRLPEATRHLYARYEQLRHDRPDDFTKSHAEYWKGVYT